MLLNHEHIDRFSLHLTDHEIEFIFWITRNVIEFKAEKFCHNLGT